MAGPVPPPGAHVTYSREYRRCGKPGCAACGPGGAGHGPYWYAHWREGGRLRSRYLGKDPPPGARAQAPPEWATSRLPCACASACSALPAAACTASN